MLALVERYFGRIAKARTDADAIDILDKLSAELGYRSGFVIEYSEDLKSAIHIVDSDMKRAGWWHDYVAMGLRDPPAQIRDMLVRGPLLVFEESRLDGLSDALATFTRRIDLAACTLVPVSHQGNFVGLGGFSGPCSLDERQKMALQLIVYALFSQVRSFRQVGIVTRSEGLTPREKEVMALSADGLTSQEIAERLGMSSRTVNQHVDNVSAKLGTKNRAHTVAEVIRHNLL